MSQNIEATRLFSKLMQIIEHPIQGLNSLFPPISNLYFVWSSQCRLDFTETYSRHTGMWMIFSKVLYLLSENGYDFSEVLKRLLFVFLDIVRVDLLLFLLAFRHFFPLSLSFLLENLLLTIIKDV